MWQAPSQLPGAVVVEGLAGPLPGWRSAGVNPHKVTGSPPGLRPFWLNLSTSPFLMALKYPSRTENVIS